jgi:hypothetical protein
MNPRNTWFLILLAVGLSAFILISERQRNVPNRSADPVLGVLPAFTPDTVASVEVHVRTNLIFHATRTNSEWKLTLPIQYPADAARIEGLLPVFNQLNSQAHISAQELQSKNQTLAAFGLAPPAATLIINESTNHWELRIGGKTIGDKQVYVQLVGSEGIYFTSAEFLRLLPQAVDDWRDPFLLRMKGLAYNRMTVKTATGGYELQEDPSTRLWKIAKPLEARANSLHIARMLETLRNWQVTRFVDSGPNLDLEAYGLRPPESTVTLSLGTNELLTAYFGKSPTNDETLVYAYCPGSQPAIVAVPRDHLDMLRVPYTMLRDTRLLSTSLAEAELIDVDCQGAEKFSVEKNPAGGWGLLVGTNKFTTDPELMRHFLGDFSTLGVVEYIKDVATDFDYETNGLLPPKRRYVFRKYSTNTVIAATNPPIAWAHFSLEHNGKVNARVLGENSIYATRAESVNKLPIQPFQLWDRQLWQFTTNEAKGLAIVAGGETNGVTRDATGQWRYVANGKPLEEMMTGILDELLFRLGNLRAEAWVACGEDKTAMYILPSRAFRLVVDLVRAGKPQTLELVVGNQAMSNNLYATTIWNGKVVVFEMRAYTCQPLVELANYWPKPPVAAPGKPASPP